MAVQWPKFLAPITVPTGGWDFSYVCTIGEISETVTIPAGTYETIYHLITALLAECTGAYGLTITVSSTGYVTFSSAVDFDAINFGSTNNDLEAVLGLAGDETASDNSLTSTYAHTYGWYPGVISFSTSNGAGPAADSGWRATDQGIYTYAGTGAARIVAPARRLYKRRLRFAPLHRNECFESRGRGPIEMMDRWSTKTLYWYFSRSDGQVGSLGTQVDPGDGNYEVDADGDYCKVTLTAPPDIEQTGGNPDWFAVSLQLAPEPK